MAKAAFATWSNRIAPVFDVSRSIQVVETEAGEIVRQTQISLMNDGLNLRASHLAKLGVTTLVCGAISRPLQVMLTAYGIEVIPFVTGNLQEVIQAWLCDKLAGSSAYAMPGCRSTGVGRFGSAQGANRRKSKMDDDKQGKRGRGQGLGAGGQGGKGQGGRRQGQGRNNRMASADPGTATAQDNCVCPQCGHTQAHERGIPCMQKNCAQCGAVMTRQ
jgi:predicted Fe-Mo cluster-binding NifX family protein